MKGVRALARGWRTVQFLAAPNGVFHEKNNFVTNHGAAQNLSENLVIRLVREKSGLSCVRLGKKGKKKKKKKKGYPPAIPLSECSKR